MNSKIDIPLYVNTDIAKNLLTVCINAFVDIKTISNRNQITVNINTPLSELTYDACKKYTQGDFNIQLQNELKRQRTEIDIEISKEVQLTCEIKKILNNNNILKTLTETNYTNSIVEGDYVEFSCVLNKNPLIEYIDNLINALEMELAFMPYNKDIDNNSDQEMKKEVIKVLKEDMDEWKKSKCIKYLSNEVFPNKRFVIPIQNKYISNNIDYINNSKVTILGKIARVSEKKNSEGELLSGTCFDFLSSKYFNEFKSRFIKNSDLINDYDDNLLNLNCTLIQIIPIAIYV